MSATVSTRWYFSDWQSDAGLRASSLAARGLWLELLAVAHQNKGKDYGFVLVAGRNPEPADIARLCSCAESEVEPLVEELEKNGVFNRDRRGVIYSRRMVRAEKNRGNGRLGVSEKTLKNLRNQNSLDDHPEPHVPVPLPVPKKDSLELPVGNSSAGSPDLFGEKEPPKPETPKKARKPRIETESDVAILDRIADLWNPFAAKHGLAQVQGLSEERAKHWRQRMAFLRELGHEDDESAMKAILEQAELSFFIRGSPRNPLRFDQILRKSFLIQLMEGGYAFRGDRRDTGQENRGGVSFGGSGPRSGGVQSRGSFT